MALFRNFYRCANCKHEWQDVWPATCDDDCPKCGARHMSPYKSEDENDDEVTSSEKVAKIRELNDKARQTFTGCAVMMTAGLAHACTEFRAVALKRVREFDRFSEANNPHGEHDFGSFQVGGVTINWQFSYYDLPMGAHSPDASDPAVTQRILTIGPSSDW